VPEPATAVERVEKKGLDRRNINISYCVQTYNRDGNKLEILRDTCVNKVHTHTYTQYIYIYIYIYARRILDAHKLFKTSNFMANFKHFCVA